VGAWREGGNLEELGTWVVEAVAVSDGPAAWEGVALE